MIKNIKHMTFKSTDGSLNTFGFVTLIVASIVGALSPFLLSLFFN